MKTSRAVFLCLPLFIVGIAQSFAVSRTQSHSRPKTFADMVKNDNVATNNDTEDKVKAKTWNPLRLMVLKLGFTEPAWTSPWNYQKAEDGTFVCAFCGHELFDADAKYDSGSGWPSFWRSKADGAIKFTREWGGGVECSCAKCGGHLGHVFMDGPRQASMPQDRVSTIPASDPTGNRLPRFCINGASMRYKE